MKTRILFSFLGCILIVLAAATTTRTVTDLNIEDLEPVRMEHDTRSKIERGLQEIYDGETWATNAPIFVDTIHYHMDWVFKIQTTLAVGGRVDVYAHVASDYVFDQPEYGSFTYNPSLSKHEVIIEVHKKEAYPTPTELTWLSEIAADSAHIRGYRAAKQAIPEKKSSQ